jgi:hypothetical protein
LSSDASCCPAVPDLAGVSTWSRGLRSSELSAAESAASPVAALESVA